MNLTEVSFLSDVFVGVAVVVAFKFRVKERKHRRPWATIGNRELNVPFLPCFC